MREAQGLERVTVRDPNGAWTAELDSRGQPVVTQRPGAVVVEAPIGGATNLRCKIMSKTVPAGQAIAEVLGVASKTAVIEEAALGIRVAADAPLVFVDAFHHASRTAGKATGELKIAVLARRELVEQDYDPGENPARLSETRYVRKPGEASHRMHIVKGDVELVGELDEQGRFIRAETSIGEIKLWFERAHARGKL
jgi:hypothetical protein